jgi:hypothetical protein
MCNWLCILKEYGSILGRDVLLFSMGICDL